MNANYRGALVYINDLEGKITKINLTNMRDDRAQTGSPQLISMYDTNIYSLQNLQVKMGDTCTIVWKQL